MPIRRLLFAPALLLGTAVARAQDDDAVEPPCWPATELPAHLAADDAREVAWAGFLVQRDRARAAIPAVRKALARLAGDNTPAGELARLELLDALIQLDVRLPGEELLPHTDAPLLRIPLLVLAAKTPEANASYFAARMDALEEMPHLEWQVCGNLLAAQHDPRFVGRCLQRVEFRIAITVRDGRQPGVG